MPRDANGNYQLPPSVNPVVSGTTITTNWGNVTLSDVATEVQDSLSRSGKGGMLAQLKSIDGTAAAPGLSFLLDLNVGFYRIGPDNMGLAVAGTKIVDYALTAIEFIPATSFVSGLLTDTVSERTADAGVTVDGLLIKDGAIDISTGVTGVLPVANGGTGAVNAGGARTNLGLEIGVDVQAWDADLDLYAANPLTAAELAQLQNIGANTISATQWGYLGGLDQGLSSTSTVVFSGLQVSGDVSLQAETPSIFLRSADGVSNFYQIQANINNSIDLGLRIRNSAGQVLWQLDASANMILNGNLAANGNLDVGPGTHTFEGSADADMRMLSSGSTFFLQSGLLADNSVRNMRLSGLLGAAMPNFTVTANTSNFSGDATFSGDVSVGGTSAFWTSGSGSPEGVLSAPIGSLYTRIDGGVGTTLYVKEAGTGNTGWAAK